MDLNISLTNSRTGAREMTPTSCTHGSDVQHRTAEYSGQKKPLVRNGGNRDTDFKETILIVLFFCSIQNVGTARVS